MSRFNITEHVIDAAHIREYARATSGSQNNSLKLHVKQYVPKDNSSPRKGDLTVIGSHANGFPKELYEPLYDDFYDEAKKQGVRIRAIWIADCAWQGQSGRLNLEADILGNDPCWYDYSRDILQMINTFRMPQPIMGMGHSFGANALTFAALQHPRLFNGLVLLDPVISSPSRRLERGQAMPAAASIRRRDVWPSREVARESFQRSKFYQSWDPRVLEKWIQYGLLKVSKDGPAEEVSLSTTKYQEIFTFLRPSWSAWDSQGEKLIHPELMPDATTNLDGVAATYPFYRPEAYQTYLRLPEVRPGVLYILGSLSNVIDEHGATKRTAVTGTGTGGSGGVNAGRVKQISNKEFGHLVPMEAPGFCAKAAAEWAKLEVDRWWVQEREFEEWSKRPVNERVTASDEWRKHLKVDSPVKPKM